MIYVTQLKNFNVTKNINKTRLKNCILAHFSDDIQEQSIERNTVLVFNDGIKSLLKDALDSQDLELENLNFAKVSKTIHF